MVSHSSLMIQMDLFFVCWLIIFYYQSTTNDSLPDVIRFGSIIAPWCSKCGGSTSNLIFLSFCLLFAGTVVVVTATSSLRNNEEDVNIEIRSPYIDGSLLMPRSSTTNVAKVSNSGHFLYSDQQPTAGPTGQPTEAQNNTPDIREQLRSGLQSAEASVSSSLSGVVAGVFPDQGR